MNYCQLLPCRLPIILSLPNHLVLGNPLLNSTTSPIKGVIGNLKQRQCYYETLTFHPDNLTGQLDETDN